jgi:two-component system OmpR family response regulator
MRVLIIEDDLMIGQALVDGLKEASYAVDWLQEGRSALSNIASHKYDLLLLDIGLPGKSGLEILRSLRNNGNSMPVLIITAREELDDRVLGLDEGADDYLVKPFKMAELLARIRAVVRRKSGLTSSILSNGYIVLDISRHEASVSQMPTVLLSNREFALLEALMIRPGAILSRSQLEERMYGWGEEVESNAIEYIIYSIRKKLGSDAIKNVRGAGWMVSKNA